MKARRSLLAAAFSATLAVLAAGCTTELDAAQQPVQSSPATASPSPEAPAPQTTKTAVDIDPAASVDDAISAWLAGEGIAYAGPCDSTDGSDIGQYCSAIADDRDTSVVAKVGAASSQYDTWLLIERSADGWLVTQKADMQQSGEQTDETPPF